MTSLGASFHFRNLEKSVKPRFKPQAPLEMKHKKSLPTEQIFERNPNMVTAHENSIHNKKATKNAREAVRAFISYAEATKTRIPGMNEDDVSIDGLLRYITSVHLKADADATITVALDLALSAVKFAHLINIVAKISSSANSAKRKTRGEVIRDMKEEMAAAVEHIRGAAVGVHTIFREDKIRETLYETLESNGIKLPDEKEWDPPEELLENFESALRKVIRVSKECSQAVHFKFGKGGGSTRHQKNRKGTKMLGRRRFTCRRPSSRAS
jgi:hypothetical protein